MLFRSLLEWFDNVNLEHVLRKENKHVNSLANLASALALPNEKIQVPFCKRWALPPVTPSEDDDTESNVVFVLVIEKED